MKILCGYSGLLDDDVAVAVAVVIAAAVVAADAAVVEIDTTRQQEPVFKIQGGFQGMLMQSPLIAWPAPMPWHCASGFFDVKPPLVLSIAWRTPQSAGTCVAWGLNSLLHGRGGLLAMPCSKAEASSTCTWGMPLACNGFSGSVN